MGLSKGVTFGAFFLYLTHLLANFFPHFEKKNKDFERLKVFLADSSTKERAQIEMVANYESYETRTHIIVFTGFFCRSTAGQ